MNICYTRNGDIMRNDIIEMLIYDDSDGLSSKYNFPKFVAMMLCSAYKLLNNNYHRNIVINKIENGFYSEEKNIKEMANSYISNAVLYSPDHGKSMLINRCGLSESEADEFISRYTKYNQNLKDLLSAELDVSNTNKFMREMIDEVIDAFIESEKEKTL